jgi:hypothetical protein
MSRNGTSRPRFHPGRIVATPGAIEAMRASGQHPHDFLARRLRGDRGDLDDEDRHMNELALTDGSRLLSAFVTSKGEKIWIITEAVGDDGCRASSCLLLRVLPAGVQSRNPAGTGVGATASIEGLSVAFGEC